MIICDEYLTFAALTNNLPTEIENEQIHTTPTAYGRLLRGIHNPGWPGQPNHGRLRQLVSKMSPSGQAALIEPDPDVVMILDPRPSLDTTARISVEHGLSWMAAEMVAAAIRYRAPLYYGREQNVPPRIHQLRAQENLRGIHVARPLTAH